ncbi:isochorismatase family cysteine hydrolase [Raineyella sp. LH-20]|uniref:cysteine hydrolase family protein n=1 Tax=Raineyella sp. LH-20 TaxID=3081204 RepID=UPI002954DFBE|nr:isochorismatase family cysteine hydrolase [Raineyella sp. LH-20]WOP19539.1 isochorismatase family cysteine hydrolase [Raineyella sp. LH-20]
MSTLPAIDPARTAVVTIDMHRGHLDPAVATMPIPADRAAEVTEHSAAIIRELRDRGLPVIHVVTSYSAVEEISANPWWASVAGTGATRANVLRHQLPGSPGLQVMPSVLDESDVIIYGKKRYDCFYLTPLELALRSRGIETVILFGINTNSCVLATTIAANVRDFTVVVASDGVDTMDRRLHEPALAVIAQAFGWVATGAEIVAAL